MWFVISSIVMLMIPWLAVILIKGDASMAICFILFYVINPFYSILVGLVAGKDIKHLWSLPFIVTGLFLLGTWIFFSLAELAFILYAVIYLILGLLTMGLSYLFGKN